MAHIVKNNCGDISVKLLTAIHNRINAKRINLDKLNLESFNIMVVLDNCGYNHNSIVAIQRFFKIYNLDCKLSHYKLNTNTGRNGYAFTFTKMIKPDFSDLPF